MSGEPEKGTTTYNKTPENGTTTGTRDTPTNTPTSTGSIYTGGGGGSSASAKAAAQKQQKETQAQLNNTADIFQRRKDDMDDNAKDYLANLDKAANDRLGDMDRNSQSALNNVIGKMGANDTQLSDTRFSNMQNIKWQPDQQKEQNTFMSLRNRMGNAAYGSGIQDLIEGMTTIDDMSDAAALDAWKQNEDSAYKNWYNSYTGLIDDYNTNVNEILEAYSKFRNEYQKDFDEFNYKYRDSISSLQSQYATTQSNINALLASKQNLEAAADPKKAVKKAKNIKKAANTTIKKSGKTVKKIDIKGKGLKGVEKKAAKLINEAIGSKSSKNSSAVKKAVNKAANDLIKNAKKPTVGSGTDKYTLPKANFDPETFTSSVNANPSAALQSMLVNKSYEPTQSNFAKEWIRPNQENEIQSGLNSGETTTSRAANSGFLDNLSAFSRVPKPNNNITQPQTKTSNNNLTGVRNINYNPTQALAKATDSAKSVAAELALYKKNQAKNTKSIAAELALKKRNQARGFA